MKTMITEINGKMYLRNNTDSTVCVSSENLKHYAVVNNHDSLYLSLCDSLPIILGPDEYKIVNYKSLPRQDCFFKNISLEKDCWGYLYDLFCNSTYSLLDIDGEHIPKQIMFHDINNYGFFVSNRYGISLRILNHGIYDKKGTDMVRFRFWEEKWDATDDAEKERIWNEAEENHQKNAERVYGNRGIIIRNGREL